MDEETRYTIQLKVLPVNGRLQHFPVQNQTLISLLQQGARDCFGPWNQQLDFTEVHDFLLPS